MVDQADGKRRGFVLRQFNGKRFSRTLPARGNRIEALLKKQRGMLLNVGYSVGERSTSQVVFAPAFALIGEPNESGFDQTSEVVIQRGRHLGQFVRQHLRVPALLGLSQQMVSKQPVNGACAAMVGRSLPSLSHQRERVDKPRNQTVDVAFGRREWVLNQPE